jgi:hypothetical protein
MRYKEIDERERLREGKERGGERSRERDSEGKRKEQGG